PGGGRRSGGPRCRRSGRSRGGLRAGRGRLTVGPEDENRVGGGQAERAAGGRGEAGRLGLGALGGVAEGGEPVGDRADAVDGSQRDDDAGWVTGFDGGG